MSDIAMLEGLPLWQTMPRVEPLAAGRTNRNFVVRDGERSYFARIGKNLPHHRIDRRVERRAAALAAAHGIAPAVVHAADGLLVTDFIAGGTLSLPDIEDQHLTAIAALLKRLHQIPGDGLPGFSPKESALFYLGLLPDSTLDVERRWLEARLFAVPSCEVRCLVHADLIPENFIVANNGMLCLVDWEYAGGGVPEVDLASIVANFDLDRRRTSLLLDGYGLHSPALLEAMREASIIREYLWCLVQARHAEALGDLMDYTALCLKRVVELGA